jgi:hypothetical protein
MIDARTSLIAFGLALSLLAPACVKRDGAEASPGEATHGGEEPTEEGMICERERVPGSRAKRRVCRSKAEVEAERRAAQEGIRQMPSTPPPPESSMP